MTGDEPGQPSTPARGGLFGRHNLEFDRLAFFTDAIYAISLTLLVVGLEIPKIASPDDGSDLWGALGDQQAQILMFFISFIVIGNFWLAHHRFYAGLAAMDRTLMLVSLLYLALIAFLPYPSGLLGQYPDNSVAVALYALCIAAVAGVEVVLQWVARTHGLLARTPSPVVVHWGFVASMSPTVLFLLSIPIAFVSPTLAILSWLLNLPIGMAIGWRMPKEAADYFAG